MKKKDKNSNSNEFASTMNRMTIQKKNYKSNHVTISLFRHEPKHSEGFFFIERAPLVYILHFNMKFGFKLSYNKRLE